MAALPDPEHIVDEAMVKEKDRDKPRRVILAHVAVRAGDRREIALPGDVEPAHRQMNAVMWAFERHDERLRVLVVPIRGARGVREQCVVGRIQAIDKLLIDEAYRSAADGEAGVEPPS